MNTATMLRVVRAFCDTIVEAVEETGDEGVPAGHMYAALMPSGCTLSQFDTMIDVLVASGRIRKRGFLLLPGTSPSADDRFSECPEDDPLMRANTPQPTKDQT